jgi:hypothetical protein
VVMFTGTGGDGIFGAGTHTIEFAPDQCGKKKMFGPIVGRGDAVIKSVKLKTNKHDGSEWMYWPREFSEEEEQNDAAMKRYSVGWEWWQ